MSNQPSTIDRKQILALTSPRVRDSARPILRSRGVESDIIERKSIRFYNYCEDIEIEENNETARVISRTRQIGRFLKVLAEPLSKPHLVITSGRYHSHEAQLAALYLMMKASEAQSRDEKLKYEAVPRWCTVDNSFKDQLGDKRPIFLVFDGLYTDSPAAKVEKVRDLLSRYSDIPRVVVAVGADPVHIAYNVLRVKPTTVLFFGRQKVEL